MNQEEKLNFARKLYAKSGLVDVKIEIARDEEINADYTSVSGMRGPGGLIIGDDGTFLFCQSAHGYSYWKEEYKKGIRSTNKE